MNPNARFALVAVAALAMASSSLLACLRGDLDLPAAGLRYALAFVVARVGVGIVDILLTGYRRGAIINANVAEAIERPGHPLRRDGDLEAHGIVEVGAPVAAAD